MNKVNAGLSYGLLGGVIIVLLYLFNLYILVPVLSNGSAYTYTLSFDLLIWIIECFLFYVLGRAAAERQYQHQAYGDDSSDPFAGVQSSGMGAALLTWLLGWLFVGVRAFIWDLNGNTVYIEPVSLFCGILFTGIFSISLGAAAGAAVVKKYQDIFNNN